MTSGDTPISTSLTDETSPPRLGDHSSATASSQLGAAWPRLDLFVNIARGAGALSRHMSTKWMPVRPLPRRAILGRSPARTPIGRRFPGRVAQPAGLCNQGGFLETAPRCSAALRVVWNGRPPASRKREPTQRTKCAPPAAGQDSAPSNEPAPHRWMRGGRWRATERGGHRSRPGTACIVAPLRPGCRAAGRPR